MIINAHFLHSSPNLENAPASIYSEIAFLGRSNVGKSSLINALCHKKNLAKSSSTPGKTQLINFFEIECKQDEEKQKFIFVDLPGFGYAKVGKDLKKLWDKNLDEFLRNRTSIKLFVHLIDARHTHLELDLELKLYLQGFIRSDQQILEVFTKADKLNQAQKAKLKKEFPQALLVSNTSKIGLLELESFLINKSLGL